MRQLQYKHTRGAVLRRLIDESVVEYDDLESEEQMLLEQYDNGVSTRRLNKGFDEQLDAHFNAPRYRGAGVALAIKMPNADCSLIW